MNWVQVVLADSLQCADMPFVLLANGDNKGQRPHAHCAISNSAASKDQEKVELPDKDEGERTIQIPGLVAGCQQPEPSFEPWEKAEKGGALKSMFFWKVKVGENLTKPATESKDNNDEKPSKDTAEKKLSKTHEESVDSTIYKILTRQRKKRLNQ